MSELKLKYLFLAHRKYPDLAHLWVATGKKKLTQLLSMVGTREYLQQFTAFFTLPPHFPTCSIKETSIQTRQDGSLGCSSPSSQSAAFPNKVAIPCTNNSSLNLLACCTASNTNLDSRTSWHHFRSCKFPIWVWSVISAQSVSSVISPPTVDVFILDLHILILQLFQLQQCLETKNVDKLDLKSDSQISVLYKQDTKSNWCGNDKYFVLLTFVLILSF